MRDFKRNRPKIFEEVFFRRPDGRVGREFNPPRTRQLFLPGKLPGRILVLAAGLTMSTLCEIKAAADALTVEQKQELLLFLATRPRAQGVKLP